MFKHASLQSVQRVLLIGAHSDDIEIGCGGAILRMARENPNLQVRWAIFTGSPQRAAEARASADLFTQGLHNPQIIQHSFRDSFLPYEGAGVKEAVESLKEGFTPDLIFTHTRDDLHQDHALLNRLTWNTFRNHWILEYEIPKYDADLAQPNIFVDLDEPIVARKIQYLMNAFPTQREKSWFTEETFRAVLRLRGVESNAPGKYAEAFHCRKLAL